MFPACTPLCIATSLAGTLHHFKQVSWSGVFIRYAWELMSSLAIPAPVPWVHVVSSHLLLNLEVDTYMLWQVADAEVCVSTLGHTTDLLTMTFWWNFCSLKRSSLSPGRPLYRATRASSPAYIRSAFEAWGSLKIWACPLNGELVDASFSVAFFPIP